MDNIIPTEVQFDLPAVVRGMRANTPADGPLEVLEVMLLGRCESRLDVFAVVVKQLYSPTQRIVGVRFDLTEVELRQLEHDGTLQPAA